MDTTQPMLAPMLYLEMEPHINYVLVGQLRGIMCERVLVDCGNTHNFV